MSVTKLCLKCGATKFYHAGCECPAPPPPDEKKVRDNFADLIAMDFFIDNPNGTDICEELNVMLDAYDQLQSRLSAVEGENERLKSDPVIRENKYFTLRLNQMLLDLTASLESAAKWKKMAGDLAGLGFKVVQAAIDAQLKISEQQLIRMPSKEFRAIGKLGSAISALK